MTNSKLMQDKVLGAQLSAEVLRVYGSTTELAGVLRAITDSRVKFTATYSTNQRIYAFLKVSFLLSETWVADTELNFLGISDDKMALAFADAILDEAEYWSFHNPLVIEDEYFDIDLDIKSVVRGGN